MCVVVCGDQTNKSQAITDIRIARFAGAVASLPKLKEFFWNLMLNKHLTANRIDSIAKSFENSQLAELRLGLEGTQPMDSRLWMKGNETI